MDFFKDLGANLKRAEAPGQEGAQTRAWLIRRLVDRVENYPDGRKHLVGTLRCVTRDLPQCVAGGQSFQL
jgi:hypothetical protein